MYEYVETYITYFHNSKPELRNARSFLQSWCFILNCFYSHKLIATGYAIGFVGEMFDCWKNVIKRFVTTKL